MIDQDTIHRFSVFSLLPQEAQAQIAACGHINSFSADETILQEGDLATDLYGVISGEVELSITVHDQTLLANIQYEDRLETRVHKTAKEIVVDSVGSGEIFGWSSLLEANQLTATVRATTPTEAIRFAASDLDAFFEQNPQAGYTFMRQLSAVISQRLRTRTGKLLESWSEAFGSNRI